jgi:hypothetical protein
MDQLLDFLDSLEERSIYYRLNRVRDAILVEIAVPGERWEVEFDRDGNVQTERFLSEGRIRNDNELQLLLEKFSE